MARTAGDVQGKTVTPGWAWAVAGLCLLLLAPMVLQRGQLLRRPTPLQVAGASIGANSNRPQRSQPQHGGALRKGSPAYGWSLGVGTASPSAGTAGPGTAAAVAPAGSAPAALDATPEKADAASSSGAAGTAGSTALSYPFSPAPRAGQVSSVVTRPWTRSSDDSADYGSVRARPWTGRPGTWRPGIGRPGTGWRTVRPRPVAPEPETQPGVVVRYRIPNLPPGWRVRSRPKRWGGYAYYFFHRG